jgi:predicted hydrocarbon binding protein
MLSDIIKKMIFSRTIKMEDGEFKVMGGNMVTLWIPIASDWWMTFDSEEERKRLYKLGYDGGRYIMKDFSKFVPTTLAKKLINFSFQFTEFTGWGRFNLVNFDVKKGGLVHNSDSPVAYDIIKRYGKQKKPVCEFIMGVTAGALSYIINKKVEAKETKCVACGDHVCEYLLTVEDRKE